MDYTNGIITDYGNHRFDSVHQIMGEDMPLNVVSSAVRFNKKTAGDIYDMQVATFEYPNFIMNYECSNYNGHGLGGRTAGMRYYGMMGPEDRPHGMAFYGTEASLFVDRIGMELYPEPKPVERVPGGGRGGRGRRTFTWEPRMEKMQMNEDEPTPLHTKNFVDFVRARKEPFANIEVGVRATTVGCIGNVAHWTGRKLKWDGENRTFPGDTEANKFEFRPYRKPWDLIKMS
jgi:predicted dehydrogenase